MVSEVRSMSNYCSNFIPDYATITEPLRRLTQKHAKFQWLPEHQAAFEKKKSALLTTPVMSYYDIDKQTVSGFDASPFGVSAVIGQRRYYSEQCNIVAYGSRSLTPAEKYYS